MNEKVRRTPYSAFQVEYRDGCYCICLKKKKADSWICVQILLSCHSLFEAIDVARDAATLAGFLYLPYTRPVGLEVEQ